MRPIAATLLIAIVAASTSYSSLYRSIMGTERLELLVDCVSDARESQAEAQEQFQTTFEAFQAMTDFDGGDVEELESEFDGAASAVSKRINSLKSVGRGLFREWEQEIGEYTSDDLCRRIGVARAHRDSRVDEQVDDVHGTWEFGRQRDH